MKRFISLFAAAAVAVLSVSGCYTESTDVIYSISFPVKEYSFTNLGGSGTLKQTLNEIQDAVSECSETYASEWIVTITNGKYSSADGNATSKYEAALAAFRKVEAEAKAKVDALPAGTKGAFTYTQGIKLSRFNSGSGDTVLQEYEFTISYGE